MRQEPQINPNIQSNSPELHSEDVSLRKKNESNENFIAKIKSFVDNPDRHLLGQQQIDEFVENFLAFIYENRDHPEDDFNEEEMDVSWWALYHPTDYKNHATESFNLFKDLIKTSDYDYDYDNISFAEKCLKTCVEKTDKFPYESMIVIDLIINSNDWVHDVDDEESEENKDIRESLILELAITARQKSGVSHDAHQILVDRLTELVYGEKRDEDDFYYDDDEYNYDNDYDGGHRYHDYALMEADSPGFILFNELRNYLDFEKKENFSRASATLSVLEDVARTKRSGISTYYNDNDAVKSVLDDCLRKNSGSYLLNLRARKLRDSVWQDGYEFSDQEGLPFLVGHNVYAVRFEAGIFLSRAEDFDEVSKLTKIYKNLVNDEELSDDEYDYYGNDFELLKKIWSYFNNEMSVDDIAVNSGLNNDGEQKEEDLRDFSYLMEDGMKKIIEEELNISLINLNLKEQFFFLQYVKNADVNDVEKIKEFVKKHGDDGLKSFLALEYGAENGVKLLEMNNKLEDKHSKEILRLYSSIHDQATFLSDIFAKNEIFKKIKIPEKLRAEFQKNIYDALLSRATDILSTAYQIATMGKAEAEFYNGKIIEVSDIEEVIEAMKVYEDFLEKMKGFFAEEGGYKFDYISSSDHGEMQIFNFTVRDKVDGKEKFATISLREEGANDHLESFEYDGEARINFLFSNEHISPHVQDKSRREATTFRLDRECLEFDESGENVINKDNTKKEGKLSLDFGSIYDDAGRENSVLGRVMSVGNYYVAQEKKKKPEYYHNKESFYHELGGADVFKEIVQTVEAFIRSKYIKEAQEKIKEAA